MEHKLIQGGEQYLPFARSRIKALKATGLKYASQKFEIDGVTIRVRIAGEHEYIEIEGGSFSVEMESGVVDVLNIAEMNVNTPLPGVLHETDGEVGYNAPFTVPSSGYEGKWSDWRLNLDAAPNHQMAGVLTFGTKPKIFGRLRDSSVSRAFSPGLELAEPPTDPATYINNPDDELLREKKLTAIFCPASIFTGKTRLYVQAMYGRPLYSYGDSAGEDKTKQKAQWDLQLVYEFITTPALRITSYREKGDESEIQPVLLETHSGVHLDDDGKHWLININNGNVVCFPLVPSKVGKKLRKYIAKNNNTLSQDDKDRLETYILSECLPDRKKSKKIGSCRNIYCMGYGWHWNWSGTQAAAVEMAGVEQTITNFETESQLFILDITRNTEGEFSTTQTTGEKSRWAVYRTYWTIMEPNWGTLKIQKTTPKQTIVHKGGGPFYVFYKRDEMQLCSVNVSFTPDVPSKRTMSQNPAYSTESGYGQGVSRITKGAEGGWLTDEDPTSGYYSMSLSVGSQTFGPSPVGKTSTKNEYKQMTKTVVGIGGPTYNSQFIGVYDPITINHDGGSTVLQYGQINESFFTGYVFSMTYESVHTEELNLITAIVPINDAESIFIQNSKTTYETRSGSLTQKDTFSTNNYTRIARYYPGDGGASTDYFRTGADSAIYSQTLSTEAISDYIVETPIDIKTWIGSAAVSGECFFPALNAIHDNSQDDVAQGYYTIASVNGAAISPNGFPPVKVSSNHGAAVFVGNA